MGLAASKAYTVGCNMCNSHSKEKLILKYKVGDLECRVVKCNQCGLIYANPRPSRPDTDSHYKFSYYGQGDILHWDKNRNLGFRKRWRLLKQFSEVNKGKILDVGCGFGGFLEMAKNEGWLTEGLDVSRLACEVASKKGLLVRQVALSEAGYIENYFDIVTCWDTLYFLQDPLAELLQIYKVLKKNGTIALRIKMLNAWLLKNEVLRPLIKFNNAWLYVFTKDTIQKMLQKAGFTDIRVYYATPSARPDMRTIEKMFRTLLYFFGKWVYYLTFKKIFLAPSALVFARKM